MVLLILKHAIDALLDDVAHLVPDEGDLRDVACSGNGSHGKRASGCKLVVLVRDDVGVIVHNGTTVHARGFARGIVRTSSLFKSSMAPGVLLPKRRSQRRKQHGLTRRAYRLHLTGTAGRKYVPCTQERKRKPKAQPFPPCCVCAGALTRAFVIFFGLRVFLQNARKPDPEGSVQILAPPYQIRYETVSEATPQRLASPRATESDEPSATRGRRVACA